MSSLLLQAPKKIIKSVSEEHHFAELAKLQSEIDALKLAAVEVIETVEEVENPATIQ